MHSKKSGLVGTLREQAILCERTTHKIGATEFSYWKASTFPVLTESERNYGISINCCCCCFVAMMAVSHPKGNQSKSLPFLIYVVFQPINCNSHLLGIVTSLVELLIMIESCTKIIIFLFLFLFFVDDKVPLKKMVCQKQLEKQYTMSSIGNFCRKFLGIGFLYSEISCLSETPLLTSILRNTYIFSFHTPYPRPAPAQTQIKASPRRLV